MESSQGLTPSHTAKRKKENACVITCLNVFFFFYMPCGRRRRSHEKISFPLIKNRKKRKSLRPSGTFPRFPFLFSLIFNLKEREGCTGTKKRKKNVLMHGSQILFFFSFLWFSPSSNLPSRDYLSSFKRKRKRKDRACYFFSFARLIFPFLFFLYDDR